MIKMKKKCLRILICKNLIKNRKINKLRLKMKKRKLLNKEFIIKTRKLQNVRIINNFNPFLNLTSKYLIAIIYKFFLFFFIIGYQIYFNFKKFKFLNGK